jgi:replication factor A1
MTREVIVRTDKDRLKQLLNDERDEIKLDVISPGVNPTKLSDVTYDMTADIAGIVREVQDKREFERSDGSDGQVRNIRLQDATADMRCALWGDYADMDLELGDPLLIRDAEIQDGWQDDIEASVGWQSEIEVLEEMEIDFVTVQLRGSEGDSDEEGDDA